jgi:enterochelin esterase-like enzyme
VVQTRLNTGTAYIFVQPGTGPERNQRSLEYDTVSDTYLHRLLGEIFPVVAMHVKMRPDGYSRAIQGLSSGGIMAFNAAFDKPEEFSRVLSWIGSYTGSAKIGCASGRRR